MISIQEISTLLFFFIWVRKLNVKPRIISPPLIVSTPSGEKTLVDKPIGPILLHVQVKSIVWDFAIYHLVEIDLILGVDWGCLKITPS